MLKRAIKSLAILATGWVVTACVSTSTLEPFASTTRAWPEPPNPERIVLVGAFTEPADLGIHPGLWARLVSVVAGASNDRMVRPMDVAATAGGGIIYVADPDARCVHRFDLERGRYDCLMLSRDEFLASPVGLALAPSGRLYVADSLLKGIYTIGAGERFLERLDNGDELRQPTGLAWDEGDKVLYVADTGSQSIKAFAPDGEFLREFGTRGGGSGEVNFPTYLWVDTNDELVLTDSLNFRIQRFGPDEEFVQAFGRNGDKPGDFARPKGIAVDTFGHVYVVDALFHGVQIFDPTGRLLLVLGEQGQGPGQFWLPNGIHVTRDNMIFVADSYNRRVQVFRYVGAES